MKITSLEAAKKQLDEAILLYFEERDAISIHALACAAGQVLHDIAVRMKKIGSWMRSGVLIREDKKGKKGKYQYEKMIKKYEYFLKHADRGNIKKTLEFNPEATEMYILDACDTYRQITDNTTKAMTCFILHIYIQQPDLMLKSSEREKLLQIAKNYKIDTKRSKKAFLIQLTTQTSPTFLPFHTPF